MWVKFVPGALNNWFSKSFFHLEMWSIITIEASQIILYQFFYPNETNKEFDITELFRFE